MTLNTHKYFSATVAFLAWGIWTYFINIESDNNLTSAIAQGLFSAVITLLMVYLVEFFYNLFPSKQIYFVLPAIFTVSITASIVVAMHVYINTYDIFNTVFPTVIVSFLFALYTTHAVKRLKV